MNEPIAERVPMPDSCSDGEPKDLAPNATVTVTVTDPLGLHLRTGKDVVRLASQFQAEITAQNLSRSSAVVDVKSILQLMQLQARRGHVLLLSAEGPDARAALEALLSLLG